MSILGRDGMANRFCKKMKILINGMIYRVAAQLKINSVKGKKIQTNFVLIN